MAETIAAAKPRGISVVPYISTGHKLAWSMVTKDYPEYAQRTQPGGEPVRDHMYAGEDHGTFCWSTPYQKAYLDLVEHVVRDYNVDGLYFDTWRPFYFWPGVKPCYCDGCRDGFRRSSGGKEIPWCANPAEYTKPELEIVAKYHHWYQEQLIAVVEEVRRIVKSHKNIPLIYNIENLIGGWATGFAIRRGVPISIARKGAATFFALLMTSAIPAILTSNVWLSVALISVATFGCTGYNANTISFPAEVFPKNTVASIYGLASMGSGFGGMVFSWLSGRLIDQYGYTPVFIGYGLMPLVAISLVLFAMGPLQPLSEFQKLEPK